MKRIIIIAVILFAAVQMYAQGPNGGRRTMRNAYKPTTEVKLEKKVPKPPKIKHIKIRKRAKDSPKLNQVQGTALPPQIISNKKRKNLKPIKHRH